MAVGLFTHMAKQHHAHWQVGSAGVYARGGYPAAQYTLQVLSGRGIDLPNHRSQGVTPELIADYQLILTMEKGHKEVLVAAFPAEYRKIFLLTEMVGESRDIVDPIGSSLIEYEDTAREIQSILSRGFKRMMELTNPQAGIVGR
jgi:protein-tyrosine-phosphatase